VLVAASVVMHVDVAADGVVSVWLSKSKVTVCSEVNGFLWKEMEMELFSGAGAKGWLAFSMDMCDVLSDVERVACRRTVFTHLSADRLWTLWHKVVPCAQRAREVDEGGSQWGAVRDFYGGLAGGVCFASGQCCVCTEKGLTTVCSACLVEARRGGRSFVGDYTLSVEAAACI
jgi:hypothetical protein